MTEDRNAVEPDTCTEDAPLYRLSVGCSMPFGHGGQHNAMGPTGQIVAAWH
ncbi:hypothetical protein [Pseudarthrobacter sp. SORGH_AS 212]|uniref:hypothetical protein n=1 Tax=Pseudarthrobacter sp. SORGH_AS 212 TaxID=3041777 RepID=UPI0032B79216